LGVKMSVSTLKWKWWEAQGGYLAWPLWGSYSSWMCLKILLEHEKNWIPECLGTPSQFSILGSSWENLKKPL